MTSSDGTILTSIPAWLSIHMLSNMCDEITYTSLHFNGETIEVWEWISNFIIHCILDVIVPGCNSLYQPKWWYSSQHDEFLFQWVIIWPFCRHSYCMNIWLKIPTEWHESPHPSWNMGFFNYHWNVNEIFDKKNFQHIWKSLPSLLSIRYIKCDFYHMHNKHSFHCWILGSFKLGSQHCLNYFDLFCVVRVHSLAQKKCLQC